MGMYDQVYSQLAVFQCSEGHDLRGVELQTKDLGCTGGVATLDERFSMRNGNYGDPIDRPFSGAIELYTDCRECPAFVQDGTFNVVAILVEFLAEIREDVVISIVRTSPSTADLLESLPQEDYMPNCRGPMPFADALERTKNRRFLPTDPVPVVSDTVKARQAVWSEMMATWKAKR